MHCIPLHTQTCCVRPHQVNRYVRTFDALFRNYLYGYAHRCDSSPNYFVWSPQRWDGFYISSFLLHHLTLLYDDDPLQVCCPDVCFPSVLPLCINQSLPCASWCLMISVLFVIPLSILVFRRYVQAKYIKSEYIKLVNYQLSNLTSNSAKQIFGNFIKTIYMLVCATEHPTWRFKRLLQKRLSEFFNFSPTDGFLFDDEWMQCAVIPGALFQSLAPLC